MSIPPFSPAYFNLLKLGAFPGRIDPWAEQARYFQQIHSGMIGHLIDQMQDTLEQMGYVAGRETSLLIGEVRQEPDIVVERNLDITPQIPTEWNYWEAAAAVMAEPLIRLDSSDEWQDRLFIRDAAGQLVTVVELISPRNKLSPSEMQRYQQRRKQLLQQRVNVVEIDLTRSFMRLLPVREVERFPYHALIYLPDDAPALTGISFGKSLPRLALPLRRAVIGVELQLAYEQVYQSLRIARHILNENRYTASDLPFPTTLTESQRHAIEKILTDWQQALQELRDSAS
jgi:hypothetical protein